ncbi:DDT domain-containing protein DDR4-like isoform X1 [Rosa rugosa]|uniref:DDT domain-containing protein DDR4-like isoform X1 n=1 Tax=Rosa rugosa TaxID=74645 RepID=UPI002B409517|nr:DDT domain-containing protein DDR4-like isoform X1 [Rosa rugosa]XP_062018953.1 DDT domain-containing protein DDR4-like isoform X1 [Rosa rugosa]XP_062018954.1 DDT domain-containing protein DDR4-like isoform X1 [Rosa rugosa]XP_062018956.1 DDT domain-containing protein DDR4-like isoform X1 [Rosa rugosa]XP_062018957.1 DDT domain-containing protein DDR4-like isoform X1 [Rosa rugosa]XP_062018958.1 DDT domain-containing protein DDR4-like isoform X1 [Rosa rugosa]XP_062018959.1 DDT domain-containin
MIFPKQASAFLIIYPVNNAINKEGNETERAVAWEKAFLELAKQDDAVAYINDALKQGTEISSFRKDKIGGDEKRTSYWYDGNTIIGHRLYKEVTVIESKTKVRRKGCLNLPNISFQWETLATNLEEFQKVMDELSSSKVAGERDAAKTIETDAIPALEKLQKQLQDGCQWILC